MRPGKLIPYDRAWVGPATRSLRPYYRSYEDATLRPHPLAGWSPSRQVAFSTKAELDSARTGLQDGDYVYYAGSGVLTISSSSGNGYTFTTPSVATKAVFDFGNYNSANHVKFQSTSASSFVGCYFINPTKCWFVGGEYTSTTSEGFLWVGGSGGGMWDASTHGNGSHGAFIAFDSSHLSMNGCTFKYESWDNNHNPSGDPHGDSGGGWHEGLIGDSGQSSTMQNCVFMVYGHDTNLGSCVEWGDTATVPQMNNNTLFIKAENNQYYVGAPDAPAMGFVAWGSGAQSGNVVELLQVRNYAGRATFCNSLTTSSTNCVTIKHGRAINTNQNTAGITAQDGTGLAATAAWDTRQPTKVIHQDCI